MASEIFRFRDFPVYQDARMFRKKIKELTRENFPKVEQYALTSQLWRAMDSVLLNIAEGSERYSDLDFSRFLNTSITSLLEVIACLDCALDDQYITEEQHKNMINYAENIYRQLRAFMSKVRNGK